MSQRFEDMQKAHATSPPAQIEFHQMASDRMVQFRQVGFTEGGVSVVLVLLLVKDILPHQFVRQCAFALPIVYTDMR